MPLETDSYFLLRGDVAEDDEDENEEDESVLGFHCPPTPQPPAVDFA
jgi:hypothetical protein